MDVGGYLAAAGLEERRPKEALAAYRRLRRAQTRFSGRLLVAGPLVAGAAALAGLALAALVPSLGPQLLCASLLLVGVGGVSALDLRWYREGLRSKARFRGMAGSLGERRIEPGEIVLAWVMMTIAAPLVPLLQIAIVVIGGAVIGGVVTAPAAVFLMATQGLDYFGALEAIPEIARNGLWFAGAIVVGGFVLLDLPARPGPLVLRQVRELPEAVKQSWKRLGVLAAGAALGIGLVQVWNGDGGDVAVALACGGAVAYGAAMGLVRAWTEDDNIFVTICRIGEGRCLLAAGRWGAASRILWQRARDPGEHVPKVLEHVAHGTLQVAYAASVGRRSRAAHVAEARDRLTAGRLALGESREPAYQDLFADALGRLQGLVRSREVGSAAGEPA